MSCADTNRRQYKLEFCVVFGSSMSTFSSFSKYPQEIQTAGNSRTLEFQWNQTLWKDIKNSGKISQREKLGLCSGIPIEYNFYFS